jgi:hypothetical protein
VYSVGLGGLHSEDEPLVIEADETHALTDIDVSSYYPGLVVNERIAPSHLDADIFCDVFNGLMETRLQAKANKQKEVAQGMKIAINSGGYGKCPIHILRSVILQRALRSRSMASLSSFG